MKTHRNYDLGKTQITENIRVSSAAIFYEAEFGNYFQYETFVFSDSPKIKSRQIIHGSNCGKSESLENKTRKIHDYISSNLQRKFL